MLFLAINKLQTKMFKTNSLLFSRENSQIPYLPPPEKKKKKKKKKNNLEVKLQTTASLGNVVSYSQYEFHVVSLLEYSKTFADWNYCCDYRVWSASYTNDSSLTRQFASFWSILLQLTTPNSGTVLVKI